MARAPRAPGDFGFLGMDSARATHRAAIRSRQATTRARAAFSRPVRELPARCAARGGDPIFGAPGDIHTAGSGAETHQHPDRPRYLRQHGRKPRLANRGTPHAIRFGDGCDPAIHQLPQRRRVWAHHFLTPLHPLATAHARHTIHRPLTSIHRAEQSQARPTIHGPPRASRRTLGHHQHRQSALRSFRTSRATPHRRPHGHPHHRRRKQRHQAPARRPDHRRPASAKHHRLRYHDDE